MSEYIETTVTLTNEPVCMRATIYRKEVHTGASYKGVLLYFHGGGLVFGHRRDLPDGHIRTFLEQDYALIAFDYRLGPASCISEIMEDVKSAINWYMVNRTHLFERPLPYYLFGRSAGAYLCLLAGQLDWEYRPSGILSYYGYTFLEESWFKDPSPQYRKAAPEDLCYLCDPDNYEVCVEAPPEQRYGLYAAARCSGRWLSCFHRGREKDFYLNYTFRSQRDFHEYPPVLLVHSLRDPDVPYMESKRLSQLLPKARLHTVSGSTHDFDRQKGAQTTEVLRKTCAFLDDCLS